MADPLVIAELIEKRIKKDGSKYCVVSEDGSKNLGCGESKGWAEKRLAQVEYFKHAKSLTEGAIVAGLEDGSLQIDDFGLGLFVEKSLPGLLDDDSVIEKHMAGKHDQSSHGHSRLNSRLGEFSVEDSSEAERALRDARRMVDKISEHPKLGVGFAAQVYRDRIKEITHAFRAGRYNLEQGSRAGQFSANDFENDLNNLLDDVYTGAGVRPGDKLWKSLSIGSDNVYPDRTQKSEVEKHELVGEDSEHSHDVIKDADVPVNSGMDGEAEVEDDSEESNTDAKPTESSSEFEESVDEKEQKHLPGKHDQQSHGKAGPSGTSFRLPTKATISDAKKLVTDAVKLVKSSKNFYSKATLFDLDEMSSRLDRGSYTDDNNVFGSQQRRDFLSDLNSILDEHSDSKHVKSVVDAYAEAKRLFATAVEKHLSGKHDQASHAGSKGSAGKVAHTPSQLRDAAARQHAKDTGMSIAQARKKVGGGAKVPTAKLVSRQAEGKKYNVDYAVTDIPGSKRSSYGFIVHGADTESEAIEAAASLGKEIASDISWGSARNYNDNKSHWIVEATGQSRKQKSLVTKADTTCLKSVWDEYYKYYSGKYISAAWQNYKAGKFDIAVKAFEKARDGFQPDKNPKEYNCLEAWRADAEEKAGGEEKAYYHSSKKKKKKKYKKSIITKSDLEVGVPISFVARPVEIEWRITKTRTRDDGVMEWSATTTKFSRDVQKDKVTRQFYEDAIRRFKSKTVPPPFFSIAHYGSDPTCDCGYEYKSLTEYICPTCKSERLLAGICTDMWIDGQQPKAKGIYYPNEVGRTTYAEIKSDIDNNVPQDERIRISMGFFPDPVGGTIHKSNGERDFMKGWSEHFAGTRVPVIPDTSVEVVEKSMAKQMIETKFDDAAAVLKNKPLAQRIHQKELSRKIGKADTSSGLVIKASPDRECPHCGAKMKGDDVDCPDCGRMIGKQEKSEFDDEVILPEEMEEKAYRHRSGEEQHEKVEEDEQEEGFEKEESDENEDPSVEATPGVEMRKSQVDEMYAEASQALEIVQKAIMAPGGNKQELLAQAANLVGAIRDYAHSIADGPSAEGQTAEAVAATQDLTPAPMPGTKVGGNPAPVPEEVVTDNANMDEAQEEAVEDPEVDAAETDQDEAEEGRLRFAKIPTADDEEEAMKPPAPVKPAAKKPAAPTPVGKSVKVLRTQPSAAVKSSTKHPAEAFLDRFAAELVPVLKSDTSRSAKLEAVQKALNSFAPGVTELINNITPQKQEDVETLISKAIQEVQSKSDARVAALEKQIENLTTAIVKGTIEKSIPSGDRVRRKSLSAGQVIQSQVEQQVKSTASATTVVPVLSGDQAPVKRFSAGEIAAASVRSGQTRY